MDYVLQETIQTINGSFTIGELWDSVFWQVDHSDQKKRLFHTLEAAQHYIRDTEHNADWAELFQEYVEANLAVDFS